MMPSSLAEWAQTALPLDAERSDAALDEKLRSSRLVFLGETNHFVHQKVEFRLALLRRLAEHRPMILVEELGWTDGRRVWRYLQGDESAIDRIATFGYKGHQRDDRDDSPRGIFDLKGYPHDLMRAEHRRFYDALREMEGIAGYYGIDMDSPGGGYDDIGRLIREWPPGTEIERDAARVPGESLAQEAARLRRLATGHLGAVNPRELVCELEFLADSLEYAALVQDAQTYEAVRPAMAYREQAMKRRVDRVLETAPADALVVLMGHAFHLARHDDHIESAGIGPGGGTVTSVGHWLVQERGLSTSSVWMLYGAGEDAQPFPDLPREAAFPATSLNAQLGGLLREPVLLPVTDAVRPALTKARVGHLYSQVVEVNLAAEADAVVYFPRVTPLNPG